MSDRSESRPIQKRYLTLFYGIPLGLALILAIIAGIQGPEATPGAVRTPQVAIARTAYPTGSSTQAPGDNIPTSQPVLPPTPDENIPSPLGVIAAELHGIQVSLWHPWTGTTGAALQSILDGFNRINRWGITVNASSYEGFGRLDEAVETAMPSASIPDILVEYGFTARHYDSNRALVDLTPYVNDPVWGFTSNEQDDFVRGFWEEDLVAVDGTAPARRLGIPFYRSAYVVFYNQSWGRELGYDRPPASPEEFRERACAAADVVARLEGKSDPTLGGYLVTPQPGAMVGWIYAFGGNITGTGGLGYQLNTPGTQKALQFLKDLQQSGCAWWQTGINPQSEFANRHALFMVGSLFDIDAQQEAFVLAGNSDEWMVIPFPSNNKPVVETYGPSMFINQSSPAEQLAAWLVVKWLVYPQNQAEWVEELQAYPTRLSAIDYISSSSSANPQWTQALELFAEARSEPNLVSWSMMRWALEDAMAQLLDPQFDGEQIPTLLQNLDSVAVEIVAQVR